MRCGDLRKYLFAALAILNLGFWVGLACLAGLLFSDQVDLGFETALRQGQATAAAAWERQTNPTAPAAPTGAVAVAPVLPAATDTLGPAASATRSLPAGLVSSLTPSASAPADPTSFATMAPSARPSRPAPAVSPSPASSSQDKPTALPAGAAATSSTPSRPAAAHSSPTAPAVGPHVASSPTQALRTEPLLLANTAFSDLSQLNAEMACSAPGRPVQIRYQEAALNHEIATLLSNNSALPYRDVQIDLKRDHVVVSGKVSVLGFQVNAVAEGTIVARDCQPRFEIESVSVANIATPGFVKARVAEMLHEAMAWYPADYPLCIEQIVIEETRASIYGTRR